MTPPDVYTSFYRVQPVLQPFINYFAVRSFDTRGNVFPKAMIADNEILINFLLKAPIFGFEASNNWDYRLNKHNQTECYISSIQTFTKGFLLFKNENTILTIHFKPTGFYHIFNISPKELKEFMGETVSILGVEIARLHEQMLEVNNIEKCITLAEVYLLKKYSSHKPRYRNVGIQKAADLLLQQKGIYAIARLANELNLTQQTLEIQFQTQVGIDPKSFCRLTRFKHAIHTKLYNAAFTWTHIAHACGYYDQMHMIKDFKKMSEFSPKDFMRIIQPPRENFTEEQAI
jgi:AraC-like DNA-binding protein